MDEEAFCQTPVGQAFRSYQGYMGELGQFTQHHRMSSGAVVGVANFIARLANANEVDAEQHKPIFHALIIIGAWSALEAYVTDFCKAVMRERPDLLEESDEIQGIKVPISDLLARGEDKTEKVYEALEKNFGHGPGVSRFESILKQLNLNGYVPQDISRQIFLAQKIRNVWAHNAGRADAQFIRNSSPLNYQLGEKVAVSSDDTNIHLAILLMYGHIITSRWRIKNGLGYIAAPGASPMHELYEGIWQRAEYNTGTS